MSTATEESGKYVERVMMSTASTLLSLFQSFVAVLIVNFARFGDGESFVCFCYFNELLFGCLIASVWLVRKINLLTAIDERTGSYQDGISC
jgi:hypothetical protein